MSKPGELNQYIKWGQALVCPKNYAVVKLVEPVRDCFAVVQDQTEITLVLEEENLDNVPVIEVEKGWRIITFDMVLPFGVVGFLAHITQALAKARLPIFTLSAYSTDHILVKEENLVKASQVLESLGLIVDEL